MLTKKKKKPWRYRWPDEVRDEVLARLLALNQERYEEEIRQGLHAQKGAKKKSVHKRTKKKSAEPIPEKQNLSLPAVQGDLFEDEA